jgi:hypothetical protein
MADEEIDIYRGADPCFACAQEGADKPAQIRIGGTIFCADHAKAFAPGDSYIIGKAVARAQLEARPAPTQAEATVQ